MADRSRAMGRTYWQEQKRAVAADLAAEQDAHAGHHQHLRGTMVECSCGEFRGVTCVAFPPEFLAMGAAGQAAWHESLACSVCGARGVIDLG